MGLLVDGDNHLILRGPRPTLAEARSLAAHFGLSFAQIAPRLDRTGRFAAWTISTREFREHLTWAFVLPSALSPSPAVRQLLNELSARGVIHESASESAQETPCAT